MSRTPVDSLTNKFNFVPKELPTSRDAHGISRTVFTHVSNLHGLLTDWVRVQDKGTKICRSIAALKLHECTAGYYPQTLKPLTETLVSAVESLKHIVEGVCIIAKQLQSLALLQGATEPMFMTWSAKEISETVTNVNNMMQKEFKLKEVVTENIAHCRDQNVIEVYASSWEFNAYLDIESNTSYLFAEVGLNSVT